MRAEINQSDWVAWRDAATTRSVMNWTCIVLLATVCLNVPLSYATRVDEESRGAKEQDAGKLLEYGWEHFSAGDFEEVEKTAKKLSKTRLAAAGAVLMSSVYYAKEDYIKCLKTIQSVYPVSFGAVDNRRYAQLLDWQNHLALSAMGKAQYELGYPDEVVLQNLLEGTREDTSRVGHHDIKALLVISEIYKKMGWGGLSIAFDVEAYNLTLDLYEKGVYKRDKAGANLLGGLAYEIAVSYAAMGYVEDSARWLLVALKNGNKNYRDIAAREKIFQPVLQWLDRKN